MADFYKDTLGPHISREEAMRTNKPNYEHPYSGKKMPRLSHEQYNKMPADVRKHVHPGAVPYGEGHDMTHHGEGKPHGHD